MIKWMLAALAALAALHAAPPASAQAPTREGSTLPMIYDSLGAQHYYANGYDGAVFPPMTLEREASSVRRNRLSPLDARAHASPAGAHRTSLLVSTMVWRQGALHLMPQTGDRKNRPQRRRTAGAQ